MRHYRFVLRITGPDLPEIDPETWADIQTIAADQNENDEQALSRWLGDYVNDAETAVSERLPEGWYAKVDGAIRV